MLLFTRRAAAAAAAACLLAVAGCNADPSGPSPAPVPTVQPTPPETSIERQQRLDFEAAEKSYRTFMTEFNRVSTEEGGALAATPVMKETATGKFLEFYVAQMRQQKKLGLRYTTGTRIGYVRRGPYTPEQLTLEVCEDGSKNKVFDREGKQVSTGQILLRSAYARKIDGRWKMWDGDEHGTANSCQ